MADHLTDLASAERHSVKPWLSNRLDFAAPVNEFASEGFALVGARLDYIAGETGGGNCLPLSTAHYQSLCLGVTGKHRQFD